MDPLLSPIASLIATSDDASASAEPAASTNRSKLARAIAVLAIGALVAYAISRYLGRTASGEPDDAIEVVPVLEDAAEEGTPEDGNERTGEDDRDDVDRAGEDSDLESGTAIDVTEDDRSPEEIVERSREDVPEPGEMAVDDEVADELLEEAAEVVEDSSEGGEESDGAGGDASDERGDTDDDTGEEHPD
ncbi:hypothetical protein [Natrarchaeobaculum aegyptiacum]|uniref:Uncharacterized protein n=1 Tax=Natrarchaeobaculum aegyptiacum TaxID=745377 RepID=A0A2Z2HSM3_9EURY|nr:hypothetical protein [Natrarchaeobaculum aegyptiacum]ARS90221.1 hypothetical protein B1756_11120 [Natrarchaeobaculum aegyptiacum]